MRFTKIVATIGPATSSLAMLRALAKNGMNVARLNFSHGTHEVHGRTIDWLRTVNREQGGRVAILLDTNGPEIRSASVERPIAIAKNEEVVFAFRRPKNEKRTVVEVSHRGFAKDVRGSKTILIDNGVMEFSIIKATGNTVVARAHDAGTIGSRRHVNVPGAHISLPSFTEKDWKDIAFGIAKNVDFIAPSFVRDAKDIDELRAFLTRKKSTARIIAKIETRQAVDDIEDIIDRADGIMIARGDLGAEIPFELVPGVQDEIVSLCRRKGKPVIVATNMLESMIEQPIPTRAELTDVAHAAVTQADATMLSGETAAGKYPVKSVQAMSKILTSTEKRYIDSTDSFVSVGEFGETDVRSEQTRAACLLAQKLDAHAIIVITKQGRTARALARYRPLLPILAFTESETVKRQLGLVWGVHAETLTLSKYPDKTVDAAMKAALASGHVRKGRTVIVVSDILDSSARTRGKNHVMTVQIRTA